MAVRTPLAGARFPAARAVIGTGTPSTQAEALVSVLSGLAKQRPLILCVEDAENLDAGPPSARILGSFRGTSQTRR